MAHLEIRQQLLSEIQIFVRGSRERRIDECMDLLQNPLIDFDLSHFALLFPNKQRKLKVYTLKL